MLPADDAVGASAHMATLDRWPGCHTSAVLVATSLVVMLPADDTVGGFTHMVTLDRWPGCHTPAVLVALGVGCWYAAC
jgi:hypothetical protein